MIVKMYRVFDKIFMKRSAAELEIEGWEHKEQIKVIWVAIHSLEDFPEVVEYDEMYLHALEFGEGLEAVAAGLQSILEESA